MRMKKLIVFLLTGALFFAPIERTYAASKKKDKKKTEAAKPEEKKPATVYSKLFKEKKNHTVSKGLITVHQYEEKVYLEMPVKLFGGEFLMTSAIESASDISLAGLQAADPKYLIIDKSDSLVLFHSPQYNLRINEQDENQRKAFEQSRVNAVYKAFPIEGYSPDSTAILFNVTSYFIGSNKDVLDLKGRSYESIMVIGDFTLQNKTSYLEGAEAFENCISFNLVSSVQLSLNIQGLELTEKPEATLGIQATLTLLPKEKMQTREANPRIGSGYVSYMDFRNVKDSQEGYYATRRKISGQEPIVFYVDTLIKPSWQAAVQKSADAWNRVFDQLGLGKPIALKPYPADSTFRSNNPLINTIAFINNNKTSITSYNITDPRTGEILSSRAGISRDFAFSVRRKGVYQMADVDARFQTYYIPDDVVCEALTAYMLKAFGRSFGLATNLAGSMAYSPEQLRSPEFTQKNGITASIMDDVMYNYLARPGDKEKGVALIIDKPGVCDEFVLRYLYAPISGDEKETLKRWAMEHDGDIRYFFGKAPMAMAYDPRCQRNDLGNDPFAAIDAKIEHLKFVVNNSPAWFDDEIPRDYRELFPDYVFIELYNNSLSTLFPYIGGIYLNEANEGSKTPSFQSVPADLQKKAVQKVLKVCEDLKWLDANREFLYLGGTNTSISDWCYSNGVPMMGLLSRLTRMTFSVVKSEKPYTQKEYLEDIEKYVFAEVRASKPLSHNKVTQIGAYINGVISISPTLKAIQKTNMDSGKGIALTNSDAPMFHPAAQAIQETNEALYAGMEPMTSINYLIDTNIDNVCYEKLVSARRYLQQAKSLAGDDISRGKCEFLLLLLDRVL